MPAVPYLNVVIEFKQWNGKKFQIFGDCKVLPLRQVDNEKLLTLLHNPYGRGKNKLNVAPETYPIGKGGSSCITNEARNKNRFSTLVMLPWVLLCGEGNKDTLWFQSLASTKQPHIHLSAKR